MLEVFETLSMIFSTACLVLIPLGITVYFIVSLYRYICAKKANKKEANPHENYPLMTLRLHLIVSTVLLVFTALMAVCAVVLMSGAISFM